MTKSDIKFTKISDESFVQKHHARVFKRNGTNLYVQEDFLSIIKDPTVKHFIENAG